MSKNKSTSSFKILLILTYFLIIFATVCFCEEEFCHIDSQCIKDSNSTLERYLFYDINPPEGFNLRRDVYMRFAILAHKLKKIKDEKLKYFKLVLPPWSRLYHWKYNSEPEYIPWGLFFDIESLKSFAPVIEMHEFFSAIKKTYSVIIDEVYILQHFKDMFETGKFEDRMKIEGCSEKFQLNYFYYKNITAKNIKCLSYHGPATKLSNFLIQSTAKTILFHHSEVALHDVFGSTIYWQCRRSMRFNKELRQIASDFRRKFLESSDEQDNTILPDNWQDEKPQRRARGGPYLAVHLRRKDFLRGRSQQMPDEYSLAEQITESLKKLQLTQVFIATDASEEEFREIVKKIPLKYKTVKYTATDEVKAKYKDGGIAIIDQIICSHARHFIGTYESTFSFRIQEEREILGFPTNTTFNCFCRKMSECPKPSVWKIVY